MRLEQLHLLAALTADGKLTRRDWQVIDALHVRGMSMRQAARHIRIGLASVHRRAKRIAGLTA